MRFALLLIFVFLSTKVFAATDPYANCIKSYDFQGDTAEAIVMAPITPKCQNLCKNECGSFSRKTRAGLELNSDVIVNCLSACQGASKSLFSSYIHEEVSTGDPNNPRRVVVRGPFAINVSCSGALEAKANIYKSRMQVVPGDEIRVQLVDSDNANSIYLCGKKAVILDPLVKSLDPEMWNRSELPQNLLDSKLNHVCSSEIRDVLWKVASNKDLWKEDLWDHKGDNYKCLWSAKHQHYTDTGIWVKDGDELSISWQSTYIYDYTGLDSDNKFSRSDLDRLLKGAKGGQKRKIQAVLEAQGSLQFLEPGADIRNAKSPFIELHGEGARIAKPGERVSPEKLKDKPAGAKWRGLEGSVIDLGVKVIQSTAAPTCDTEEKRIENYDKCGTIQGVGVPLYIFQGVLGSDDASFSKTPAPIAIRHWWANYKAIGGSKVSIEWNGCPFYNGQMLQYAISDLDLIANPNDGAWEDIPDEVFGAGNSLISNASGNVYLRIKELEVPADLPEHLKELYTNPANRFGQYYVSIAKLNQASFVDDDGIIKSLIQMIRKTLYGDEHTKGATAKLFESLVKENVVIAAIRNLLVLFVVLTGFGYLAGVLQINQKDLVTRLIKISIIATLISPGSWEFFSQNFFKLFMEGGLELIAKVISGSVGPTASQINIDPAEPITVFSIFDGPFKMLTSSQTFWKVVALIMSGFLGVAVAIMIVIAIYYYLLSMAKVILMYLMSVVIISLLIFTTPLFLCFMLFQQTQSFFSNWWKYLISFTLQPMALFASIAIFNILIITVLFTALGFTACKTCWLPLYIPGVIDTCLIPVYRILAYSHFPDQTPGLFMPIGVLQASILMLILTQGMYAFCNFISKVTHTIVIGGMVNITTLAEQVGGIGGSLSSIYGRDQESIRRRIDARNKEEEKKRREEEAKKGSAPPRPNPGG
ncbi:MAG: putative type secretion system protein [Candidatus Midichloriaceae bacterium]|jgi:type IV secretion system protein VirB6|nr:putative type secretion system protein [Candidatus Midichloriaceae bacterium]